MNKITVIAIKDLRLLFRDKVGLFFIFAFPVCMGLLFGLVTPGRNSGVSGFSIANENVSGNACWSSVGQT